MWYTYILQSSKDGKYYIGSTGNLDERIERHNMGACTATKNRRPLVLAYSESFDNRSAAVKREMQIKSYKGGQAFKKLFSNS